MPKGSGLGNKAIVRFNGLLDEVRHADGTPLPNDTVVIGLIDPDKPGAYNGADFYSRFDTVEQCPLTTIPRMAPVLNTITEQNKPESEPIQINLCHASNWMTQLMGGWTLQHGTLYFEEGQLVSALKSGRPIEIQNPPTDSAFDIFWQQARLRKSIEYAGVSYPFHESVQCFRREGYDWQDVKRRIFWSDVTPSNARVLNPLNLSEFSVQYQFDETGLFTRAPGFLAEHFAKNPGSPLPLLVTRSLSQDEWGLFLNEAAQYETLKLAISCAPGVTLPEGLGHQRSTEVAPMPAWDKTCQAPTTCIVSDDPDLTIAGITKLQPDCIVLNISECTASNLIKKINGNIDTLELVFSETEQALSTLLKADKKVVLTGTFSDELLDGLAAFIRQRANTPDAPGQLIMVSLKAIGFMDSVFHEATLSEKRAALMDKGFNEEYLERLQQEEPSCMATQSFMTLNTRLRFQHAHPDKPSEQAWEGLSALRPSIVMREFSPAASEQAAKAYLDARLTAFNQALQDEPYVFLAGLTGVGKSRFVENELSDRSLFHGEASIQAWINASPDEKPTLFLDEANLSTRQWSELEGLFNTPPGLLIDGKYHPLSEHHKVIFAGNPLSYGDERKLAPLFARHGNSIVFEPLSNAFIYEKTLKPILKEQFDEKEHELIGKELLRAYDFLIGVSRDEVLISPRQIQMMALGVIEYHHRFPTAEIQEIATFQARHIAYPLVPREHLERFNQALPPVDRAKMLKAYEHRKPEFENFQATPSRDMALWQLTDFLSLRTFQRETQISNVALRLGGLHRFVIEGEPGIGKSEMVIELMTGMGLHELRLGGTQALEKKNGFYRLSASMQPGMQEAILLQAFDDGAIVLIDEINSMPTLEKMLNSLLDGKHPNDDNRPPDNPGFRVLGTQNPPTMAGRRLTSPALENRTQTVRLSSYPEKELHTILENIGVTSAITRTELIEAFESKVKEAKVRHLTPAPSFRNFIHLAKQRVEGHAKALETSADTQSISNVVKTKAPGDVLCDIGATNRASALKDELKRIKSTNESPASDSPSSRF